jgi:hypothetical protein
VVTRAFFAINFIDLNPDEDEFYDVILKIVVERLPKEQLAAFFERNSRPLPVLD